VRPRNDMATESFPAFSFMERMRAIAKGIVWWAIIITALVADPPSVHPCTLWAAAGGRVAYEGTLIAKNRDNTQELVTELRYVKRDKGFRFVALFDIEADGYVVSGTNEKGLTVVNASAASVTEEKRNVAKEDLTERILTSFDSVDAVIKEDTMLSGSHPAFYMIADSVKIASIEIAPGGKTSVKVLQEGFFVHTNHYIDEKLLSANEKKTPGSAKRLERINRLMGACRSPFTAWQFITFSEDKGEVQNDAIWRTCGPSKKVCTLASWIVYLPKQGFPRLYARLPTPQKPDRVYRFTLDDRFWMERFNEEMP
jgi:hypothetical protein